MEFIALIGWICMGLAGLGAILLLASSVLVRGFLQRPMPTSTVFPGVTILKPLHGAEPGLRDNLASFCGQDYPGEVQIIFGVQNPQDSALPIAQSLRARFSQQDIAVVVDPRTAGTNRKIANLANMLRVARHPVLLMSDSDIGVGPDHLSVVIAALDQPGVGLVTCLYRGKPLAGLWSKLSAMGIDAHFLPNVLLGLRLGRARPCFGSTMALRRSLLDQIGGFAALAEQLADDHALGEAVRRLGWKVAIPPIVVTHACAEGDLAALVAHELRWARTIRAIDGRGFAGSALTHPVALAAIATFALGFSWPSTGVLLASLAARLALWRQVNHALQSEAGGWRLAPLRDLLSFAIYVAAYCGDSVTWRGERFRVGASGLLSPGKD